MFDIPYLGATKQSIKRKKVFVFQDQFFFWNSLRSLYKYFLREINVQIYNVADILLKAYYVAINNFLELHLFLSHSFV